MSSDDLKMSDIFQWDELQQHLHATPKAGDKEKPEELKHLEEIVKFSRAEHEADKLVTCLMSICFIGTLTYITIKASLGYPITEEDLCLPATTAFYSGVMYLTRAICWSEKHSAEKDLKKYLDNHPE